MAINIFIYTIIGITLGTFQNMTNIGGIPLTRTTSADKTTDKTDVIVIDASEPFPLDAIESLLEYIKEDGALFTFGGYAFETIPRKKEYLDFEERKLRLNYSELSHRGRYSLMLADNDREMLITELEIDSTIKHVTVSSFAKACSIKGKIYFRVDAYNKNHYKIGSFSSGIIRGNEEWSKISRTVPIPDGSCILQIFCIKDGDGIALFDDMEIKMYNILLNTRYGVPADWLIIDEEKIGLFDPSFILKNTNHLKASENQCIIPNDFYIPYKDECPTAVALTGNNHPMWTESYSRYISLIDAYDKYSEKRGPYLALVHNYDGPFKGSSWAFTSGDINFPLENLIHHLHSKCYLYSLKTEFASYKDNEKVRVYLNIANYGMEDKFGIITVSIKDRENERTIWRRENEIMIYHKRDTLLDFTCELDFESGLYLVDVKLYIDGELWDKMETGFVRLNEEKSCLFLGKDAGRLLIDGQPKFLFGVNQAGFVFSSESENPLVWDVDIRKMRDSGIQIFRQLQIAAHLENPLSPSKTIVRKLIALCDICDRHEVIFWLDTRLGNIPENDDKLQEERIFREMMANQTKYYKNIIYELGNETKYEGKELHRKYWFEQWAMETSEVLNDKHPLTFSSYIVADMFMTMPFVDFISPHYYKQSDELPTFLKIIGSNNSLGEFGAKVHPTWGEYSQNSCVGITEEQAVDWFLKVGHYSLAFRYNSILAWDWKDIQESIFPWGINYVTLVPKKTYTAYRNMAYFFKIVDITYEDSQLYVICPYEKRQNDKLKGLIQQMLDFNVDFELVNSRDDVPDGCKKVVYYDRSVIRQFLTAVSDTTNATTTRKYLRHSDDGEVYIFINEDIYKDKKEIQVDSTISIELAKNKSGLVSLNKNGNVVGCGASGTLKMDGKTIINASFHFMVYTLDELPLEKSKSILLLPFSKGEFSLNTVALWENPMVEVGKIDGGEWSKLGRINIEENILFDIDETDANYIILISEKNILHSKTIPALLEYIL